MSRGEMVRRHVGGLVDGVKSRRVEREMVARFAEDAGEEAYYEAWRRWNDLDRAEVEARLDEVLAKAGRLKERS
jgi:hypothetical protein